MKEYGSVGSRSKLYSIDLGRRSLRTLGLRKSGDLLLALDKELVTYNPDGQKIKNVGVCGTKDAFNVTCYVESLVLLEEGHEVLEEAQLILFLIFDTCFLFRKYDQLGCDVYTLMLLDVYTSMLLITLLNANVVLSY